MKLSKLHIFGIISGLVLIAVSLLLLNTKFFFLLIGIGIILIATPFVLSVIRQGQIDSEKEEMFLEFARDLVESVKSGTPINKSIVNSKDKPYGALTIHVQKLANQISLGIPLKYALQTFSDDIKNATVSRALTLIGQAEKAGGDIGRILEAVASAVTMSDKLSKERESATSTLVVQGYVIFFIFLVIVLVMQFKILPLLSNFTSSGLGGVGSLLGGGLSVTGTSSPTLNTGGGSTISSSELSNSFLFLLLAQGFFSGLTIGKLSKGSVKAGIKHSFAMMIFAFVVSTGANIIFG